LRDGTGLRVAAEIMVSQDAVRRLIRDGATHQLRSTIASSRRDGSQTLESHLCELVASGEVDVAEARAASLFPEEIHDAPASGYRRR
jgi:twitching motility protein PilT